jgi:serine/threonine protein kinase
LNDQDNPAPALDSQAAQALLDTLVPTPGNADATLGSAPAIEALARRDLKSIGPYRLVKKIGEGGMGQVWLAEQSEPVRRQVALKLIKVGMHDDGVLKRFQAERQSLAMMDHPAIA